MLTAIGFILLNLFSYVMALSRGPFWGLIASLNIYFNAPNELLNWWVAYLPFHRWSLLTSAVIILSLVIHRNDTAKTKFGNAKWAIFFFIVTTIITFTTAYDRSVALSYLYLLATYLLIIFILLRSISNFEQFRIFIFGLIVFSANLSLNAYLYGERRNARLEYAGTGDAYGSNEFGILLASIMPFAIAFIICGKRWERWICILSMPFLLNAFILCNSRGATVALGGAVGLAMIFIADNRTRLKMIPLGALAVCSLLFLADDEFITRFSSLIETKTYMQDEESTNQLSSGRTEIWKYGLIMAKDHPMGIGPNGFKQMAHLYMPEDVLTFHPGSSKGVRSAHNTYLQIFVEQGFIGLTIFLVMCAHTLWVIRKSYKTLNAIKSENSYWVYTTLCLGISIITTLIGGFLNSRIYYEFFWWQIAMSVVLYALIQKIPLNSNHQQ